MTASENQVKEAALSTVGSGNKLIDKTAMNDPDAGSNDQASSSASKISSSQYITAESHLDGYSPEQELRSLSASEVQDREVHTPPIVRHKSSLEAQLGKKNSLRSQVSRTQALRYFPPESFQEAMEDRLLRYSPSVASTNIDLALSGNHPLQRDDLEYALQPLTTIVTPGRSSSTSSEKYTRRLQENQRKRGFIADIPNPVASASICAPRVAASASPLGSAQTPPDEMRNQMPPLEGTHVAPATLDTDELMSMLNDNGNGNGIGDCKEVSLKKQKAEPLFRSKKNSPTEKTVSVVLSPPPQGSPVYAVDGYQRSPWQQASTASAYPLEIDDNGHLSFFQKLQRRTSNATLAPGFLGAWWCGCMSCSHDDSEPDTREEA